MIVEVFRTNVSDPATADSILHALRQSMQVVRVTFDLEDCDRVLRVEGKDVCVAHVAKVLSGVGFQCFLLE